MDHTPHRPSRRRRRLAAGVAASALLGAGALVTAAPAQAEPVTIEGATIEWSISEEVGAKAPPFGGCNFLSAGASDGTEAEYRASQGDVEVARIDGAPPTWATRCAGVGSEFQKVVWSGGSGTVDPATGEVSLSFAGELSINFYGGLVPFTIKDPVLTLDSSGDGQIVATMYGWESSMEDPNVKVPVDPVHGVVVVDLSGVDSANETGFTVTPDYEGVEYEPPAGSGGTAQNRTNPGWGSWPSTFVDFHYLTGLTSYWYSSGGAADPYKAPSPITVSYDGSSGGGGEPGDGEQLITVDIPETTGPGEFLWSIDGDQTVDLGEATDEGTYLQATGAIDPISVTDTRDGGPEWTISGQVSDFTGGVPGSSLGWTPEVLSAGAGAMAGAVVPAGIDGGDGLSVSSILASAPSDHDGGTANVGADLDLRLPVETDPGSYTATLTITALS